MTITEPILVESHTSWSLHYYDDGGDVQELAVADSLEHDGQVGLQLLGQLALLALGTDHVERVTVRVYRNGSVLPTDYLILQGREVVDWGDAGPLGVVML